MGHNDLNVDPRGATGGSSTTLEERILAGEEASRRQIEEEQRSRRQPGGGGRRSPQVDRPTSTGINYSDIIVFTDPRNGTKIRARDMPNYLAALRNDTGYTGSTSLIFDERFFNNEANWIRLIRDLNNHFSSFGVGNEQELSDLEQFLLDRQNDLLSALSGGGRGSAGPTYVKPDRAAVENGLKPYQIAVTGTLQQEILDESIETYLTTHRKDFNDKTQQHDPLAAAQGVIRNSTAYKDIHELRPESEDELTWVTGQQARLRMVGLNSQEAETLGVQLARVGASEEATQSAGERAFFRSTGRVAKDQRASLKRTASAVLGLL